MAPGVSRLSDPRKSNTEVTMPFITYTCKSHTAISAKSFGHTVHPYSMLEETAQWYECPQAKIAGANVVAGYHIVYCQKVTLPSYVS